MLNAILRGKKKGSGLAGVWLSEDTLTSTVFERLLYLPDETLIGILFDSGIWGHPTTRPPGKVIDHQFWPWWEPTRPSPAAELDTASASGALEDSSAATEDPKFIQPDLIIEFDDRVLIVEAKRWDFWDRQLPTQLARQYARALTQFGSKPIWLMAVGGLQDTRPNTKCTLRQSVSVELRERGCGSLDKDLHFAALAWHELLKTTADALHDLPAYQRLLADLRDGAFAHGIRVEPAQWLSDLTSKEWRASTGDIASSPAVFRPKLAQELIPVGICDSAIGALAPGEA